MILLEILIVTRIEEEEEMMMMIEIEDLIDPIEIPPEKEEMTEIIIEVRVEGDHVLVIETLIEIEGVEIIEIQGIMMMIG